MGFELHLARKDHVFLKIGELPSQLGVAGHPQLLALFDRKAKPDIRVTTLDHLAFEIPAEEFEAQRTNFQAQGRFLRERAWPNTLDWRARSFFIQDP